MTGEAQFSTRPARRATFLLNVRDHAHHGSLMVKIMQKARRAQLAGATVFEAYEGFGGSGRLHQNHTLSEDAPLSIIMIDDSEKINTFLESISDLLTNVVVIIDDVEIVEL